MSDKIKGGYTIYDPNSPNFVSWVGKKVRMKETAQDLLWMVIFAGVDHFVVTHDTGTQIKLDGFGGALFNKTDFNLVP